MFIYVDTSVYQLHKNNPSKLALNDVAVKQDYDANLPIENLFNQIDTAVEYAAAGGTPYTSKHIITKYFNLFF